MRIKYIAECIAHHDQRVVGIAPGSKLANPFLNRAPHQPGRMRHQFGKMFVVAGSWSIGVCQYRQQSQKRLRIMAIDQSISGFVSGIGAKRLWRHNGGAAVFDVVVEQMKFCKIARRPVRQFFQATKLALVM